MSTDENDIVLDPFVGTGTTVIADKKLGRKFIGIDIDEKYINITLDKLYRESSNSKLGNVWVSIYLDEVVTIRDKDWNELSQYFTIPLDVRDIDFKKAELKSMIGEQDYDLFDLLIEKNL